MLDRFVDFTIRLTVAGVLAALTVLLVAMVLA